MRMASILYFKRVLDIVKQTLSPDRHEVKKNTCAEGTEYTITIQKLDNQVYTKIGERQTDKQREQTTTSITK